MRYVVMAMVMVLTSLDVSMSATLTEQQRESLRGLQGISVHIEEPDPDISSAGLSREAIRTAVELILRSSGIQILSKNEAADLPATPALDVWVRTIKAEKVGLYAVAVQVFFYQQVSLVRRVDQQMLTPTWTDARLGVVGRNQAKSVIEILAEQVKSFANDFLAVNPR